MDIALLAHHIEFLPALAEWYRDEWEPYYGVDDALVRTERLGLHVTVAFRCHQVDPDKSYE